MTSSTTSVKQVMLNKVSLMPQEEMLDIKKDSKIIKIGIPADNSGIEHRVPLAPLAVEMLLKKGGDFEIIIERGAGKGANFSDHQYSEYGARITEDKAEIYSADIILKIFPLTTEEIALLSGNQIIFTSLHTNTQDKNYFIELMSKKVTAIAFESMQDNQGSNPIVKSMSEIAGRSSILIASEYLSNVHKGKGEMLGGITGVSPSEVVIIGAGVAGTFAAQTAYSLGALVKVFDYSVTNLSKLQQTVGANIFTSTIHSKVLLNAIKTADVVIGAIRNPDRMPNIIVTEEMVKMMKPNSVIIDIGIDQGGIFETGRPTTHKNPVYIKHGIIHYCVPNIASRVARTASYAISNVLAEELLRFNKSGSIIQYLKQNPGIRSGVYIFNGVLTDEHIGLYHGLFSKDIDLLLAAL